MRSRREGVQSAKQAVSPQPTFKSAYHPEVNENIKDRVFPPWQHNRTNTPPRGCC